MEKYILILYIIKTQKKDWNILLYFVFVRLFSHFQSLEKLVERGAVLVDLRNQLLATLVKQLQVFPHNFFYSLPLFLSVAELSYHATKCCPLKKFLVEELLTISLSTKNRLNLINLCHYKVCFVYFTLKFVLRLKKS